MKLTIERAALLRALGHVQSAVERRNTIPILSNVLLSAERGRLSFSATDLDMEIVDEAEARVEQAGQVTAPAHTLYEIARKLPEGAEVTLAWTGEDPRLAVSAAAPASACRSCRRATSRSCRRTAYRAASPSTSTTSSG